MELFGPLSSGRKSFRRYNICITITFEKNVNDLVFRVYFKHLPRKPQYPMGYGMPSWMESATTIAVTPVVMVHRVAQADASYSMCGKSR